ncbi:hypothetical protein [Haloarchaeobius sp. TZWWS8]|uniref:hypothetical protein n=1 Tax=Haloarchaeobius sp. TZWWS8 TaxID=3446121 RepID=UPI003EBCDABA
MQRRRTYLAAVGTAIATAGCFGGSNDDESNGSKRSDGTDTPSGPAVQSFDQPLAAGNAEVSLSKPAVQDSYFAALSEETIAVMAVNGKRFVFLTVDSTGDVAPKLEDFTFEAGDSSARAWTAYDGVVPARNPTAKAPYTPERGSGWIGFAVPAPLKGDHVVSLSVGGETVRTRLPESTRSSLQKPIAEYDVSNFSAPESASPGDTVTVSFDIENTNGTAGVFHGALNGPEPKLFELQFAAGGSETREVELTAKANDEEENEMDLVLYAVGARERASVSLGDGGN